MNYPCGQMLRLRLRLALAMQSHQDALAVKDQSGLANGSNSKVEGTPPSSLLRSTA